MALSNMTIVSDGNLEFVSISFNYLDRSEINVYFDSIPNSTWAWVGDTNQIKFTPKVPNGVTVLIARMTDASDLRHVFSEGAAFTAKTLDEDLRQVLHIVQEAKETNLSGDFYSDIDMHGFHINNLSTATLDNQAVSLGQYRADVLGAGVARDEAEGYRDQTLSYRNEAEGFKNTAQSSATTATTQAGTATTQAGNASISASDALGYRNTTLTYRNQAEGFRNDAEGFKDDAEQAVIDAANASRLTMGTVTTGAAGSSASASISGSAGSQVLALTIPRGDKGEPGNVQSGGTPVVGQIAIVSATSPTTITTGYGVYAGGSAPSSSDVMAASPANIELNYNGSGNRTSYIDFHSRDGTDYDARIMKNPGVSGSLDLVATNGSVYNTIKMYPNVQNIDINMASNAGIILSRYAAGAGYAGEVSVRHNGTPGSSNFYTCYYNNTGIGSITVASSSSVSFNTSSDYRLKYNEKDISSALSKIAMLAPYEFNWKADDTYDHGFFAHELQDVLPHVVTGEKDGVNEEGDPVYQQVDYSRLVPLLTKGIQELMEQVQSLQSTIKELEDRITELENNL